MKCLQSLSIVLLLASANAFASDEIIRYWRSMRANAMGGTVVTTGDYADALFANPARHVEIQEGKASVLDLNIEMNTHLMSNLNRVTEIRGSGTELVSTVAPLAGGNLHGRVGILSGGYSPTFFNDDWGFAGAFVINPQLNVYPHFDTNIDSQTYVDIGPHFGTAHKFLDGNLSVGVNMHIVYRLALEERVNALDLVGSGRSLSLKSLGTEGLGFDVDLGAFYKIPWEISWTRLSVGATLNGLFQTGHNLVQPELVAKDNMTHPPRYNRTLGLGLRADIMDLWIFKDNILAFEMTDIGSLIYQSTVPKRVHMGMETKFTKWLLFRSGINQGYLTAGLGFDLPVLNIDLSTWGEELGPSAGARQDRRVGLRLAIDL